MSSDPGAQDGAAPPDTAPDSDGNANVSPVASPEQIYQAGMARLAAITDQWQQARDALLGGSAASTVLSRPGIRQTRDGAVSGQAER